MVQEVTETTKGIEIPRWTLTWEIAEQKSKELLEWFELFEQVEKLEKQLILKESNETIPWLMWCFILYKWKKVAYFSYRKVNWRIELVSFGNSNAKKDLDSIKKESIQLYENIKNLNNIKIPLLWQASFLKFVLLIKKK